MVGDDLDEPKACHCCRYENIPLITYGMANSSVEEQSDLCGICSGSLAGSGVIYPGVHGGHEWLAKIACYCANAILDHMGAFEEWRRERCYGLGG